MNVAASIYRAVRQFPEHVAAIEGDVQWTYQELHSRAMALADYFLQEGMKPGDRIAAWLPNSLHEMALAYATWWAGGVFVPLNTRVSPEEVLVLLSDAQPRWVAVTPSQLSVFEGSPWPLLVAGGEPVGKGVAMDALYQFTGFPKSPAAVRQDGDLALLMYTSGTTGRPKGVRQTHRNNTASAEMVIEAWDVTSADRFLVTVPLFHVGGMQCAMLPALIAGATVILLPKWSAPEWVHRAHTHHATIAALVTTMLIDATRWIGSHPGQVPHLSDMRIVVTGGSATPAAVCDEFEKVTGLPLIELYGQTELTGLAVTYRAGEKRLPNSMGHVQGQTVEAKILDAGGHRVPPGSAEVGELMFRGDTVSPGYWHNDAKTAERLVEGWLHTGDIVRWDAEEFLYYIDRADDMIITGGENVYPAEVEAVLSRHPGVVQVAIVGLPHERWGQQVTAFVVCRDDTVTEGELVRFLKEDSGLADYKRPGRIVRVQNLPTTGSGKINKAQLKQYGTRT